MLPAFVIGLREGLEAVVILGAIAVFLRVNGRPDLLRRVWHASALATGICLAVGLVLRFVEVNLLWRQQEQLETVVGLAAALMVTYMVLWMRRFPKDLERDANQAAASALARNQGRAIVLLAFFAVLREGLEIAVFVLATIGLTDGNAWLATGGACLGVLFALVVGVTLVRGSRRLDVARFFRVTAFVLVLSAAGIAMSTVHTANAAGWITFGQTPQFDLSWLAPPGSVLSSFTMGMFGLQPYPVLIEVIIWVAYFVPMVAVVLWPRRLPPPARTTTETASFAPTAEPALASPRRLSKRQWLVLGCVLLALAGGLFAVFVRSAPGGKQLGTVRGVLYATLDDVTCPSTQTCVAVGEFLPLDKDSAAGDPDGDGRAAHTLVESSNGRGWNLMPSPDEGLGGALLSGVSCPTSNDCVAVGSYRRAKYGLRAASTPADYPLIESKGERHGSWHVVPSPSVAANSVLTSVSCASVTSCVAVGSTTNYLNGGARLGAFFIEDFDGRSWTLTPVAPPAGSISGLSSVSCPSITLCVAVGNIATRSHPSTTWPLIELLANGRWTRVALPPGSNGPGILYEVACASVGHCMAVGNTEAERSTGAALVLSLSGSKWTTNAAALDQKGEISLTAVACTSAAGCVVAGSAWTSIDAGPQRVLAQINGVRWRRLGVAVANDTIEGIACPGSSHCLLVGSVPQNVFGNTSTMIISLSRGSWTVEPSPVP